MVRRFATLTLSLVLSACTTTPGQQTDEQGNGLNSRGCSIAFSGGIGGIYLSAGFLTALAEEKIHVHDIVATEYPSLAAVWFADRQYAFDLEWQAKKFEIPRLGKESYFQTNWPDKLSAYLSKNLKVQYFEQLSVPLTVAWTDRMAGKLIMSRKGGLSGPLRKALTFVGAGNDASVGSANEMEVLAGTGHEGPWIWFHVDEMLAPDEPSSWNSWRRLIHETIRSRAAKEKPLFFEARVTHDREFDESLRNRLFRDGKILAQNQMEALKTLCGTRIEPIKSPAKAPK